uniref:Uncharacterized protein n=1 Tax=Arundo donax TaxID=35708 RepID=A0A0A9H7A6_ARUDO
MARQQQET